MNGKITTFVVVVAIFAAGYVCGSKSRSNFEQNPGIAKIEQRRQDIDSEAERRNNFVEERQSRISDYNQQLQNNNERSRSILEELYREIKEGRSKEN